MIYFLRPLWQGEGRPYTPTLQGSSGARNSTMTEYKYDKEKIVALSLADLLEDELAKSIIQNGDVVNSDEATHLSKFF